MKKLRNKKGFTLIELIVVIAILAVLALILIPSISNYVAEAREARNNANARALYSEVAAEVAFGTITADGTRTANSVTCTYEVTDGALDTFACTAAAGQGDLTVTFSP